MNYSDVDIQQHNALNVYKTSLEVKVKNGKKTQFMSSESMNLETFS